MFATADGMGDKNWRKKWRSEGRCQITWGWEIKTPEIVAEPRSSKIRMPTSCEFSTSTIKLFLPTQNEQWYEDMSSVLEDERLRILWGVNWWSVASFCPQHGNRSRCLLGLNHPAMMNSQSHFLRVVDLAARKLHVHLNSCLSLSSIANSHLSEQNLIRRPTQAHPYRYRAQSPRNPFQIPEPEDSTGKAGRENWGAGEGEG